MRYLGALVALTPADEAAIDAAAARLLDAAATQGDAFYERSARSLRRVSTRLRDWNRGGAHAAVLRRFDARLASMCGRLDAADPQRTTCESLLRPEPRTEG